MDKSKKTKYTTIQIPLDSDVLEAIDAAREILIDEYESNGMKVNIARWGVIKAACNHYVNCTNGGDRDVETTE